MIPRDEPPLRILLFCTKYGVGGIARHALELGAWLRTRGHTVTFAGTPGAWLDREKDPDFVALDSHGVSGGDHGAPLIHRLTRLAASSLRLRRWLRQHRVNIIHAHESAPALVARLATLGGKIPIVLTFHGAEPGRMRQYGAIARTVAANVISVSRRGAEDLVKLGVARDRVTSIGLGVPPPVEVDTGRVARLRGELLGTDGRYLVVTVARLSRQKGIDTLIEVVEQVRRTRPDIRFVVVGDGPLEGDLRKEADMRGLSTSLHFVGRSNEPGLYLRAADLFLLTSRWEALPFTIVEGFQAGLPAIVTDCGGVRELVDDSVGRVLPIGDVEAIASAVMELVQDESLRRRMSVTSSLRMTEDRFKPEFVHEQIESLYYEILRRRR